MASGILYDCICGRGYWKRIGDTGPQSAGYSFGKGLVGTALFGPVGAVAGIGGKKTHTVTYQCSNCGAIKTITYDQHGNAVR